MYLARYFLTLVRSINTLRQLTGQIRSHKIVKVASSNSAQRVLTAKPRSLAGAGDKEGQLPFELRLPCMHTVLPVEA